MRVEKARRFPCSIRIFCKISTKNLNYYAVFFKLNLFNSNFHENLFGSFRVVTCVRTDGQSDFNALSAGRKSAEQPSVNSSVRNEKWAPNDTLRCSRASWQQTAAVSCNTCVMWYMKGNYTFNRQRKKVLRAESFIHFEAIFVWEGVRGYIYCKGTKSYDIAIPSLWQT
jgi:hypothetical protein